MAGGLYRGLHEFKAETESDLQLTPGDLVKVTQQVNKEWYEGATKTHYGQFPASYVERIFDNAPDRIGIALTNFTAQESGDITFTKGDIVAITENIDQNWLTGFTINDKGIFPTEFVEEIDFHHSNHLLNENNNSIKQSSLITNNESNKTAIPWAEAIDTFHAQDPDELTIRTGCRVELIKEIDSFWIEGVVDGKRGKFPKTFIKVIIDLPDELKFIENASTDDSDDLIPKAKATFMFVGTKPEELSFDKGDMIILTKRINRHWLRGRIGKSEGMFPSNHVDIVVDLPFSSIQTNRNSKISDTNDNQNSQSISPNSSREISPTSSPVKAKVSAGNIPVVQPRRPEKKKSFRKPPCKPPPVQGGSTKHAALKQGSFFYQQVDNKPEQNININTKKKSSAPIVKSDSFKAKIPNLRPRKKSSTASKNDVQVMHQFELTEERVFNIDHDPIENKPELSPKPQTVPNRPNIPNKKTSVSNKPKAPARPDTFKSVKMNQHKDLLSSSPPKTNHTKLPKPLAPMPHFSAAHQPRPSSLNLNSLAAENTNHTPYSNTPSPISFVNSKSMTVFYTKEKNSNYDTISNGHVNGISENRRMSRSETDPLIFKGNNIPLQLPLTPDHSKSDNVRSLYFATAGTTSPEKRHQTLDAMLQRSASLRTTNKPSLPKQLSESTDGTLTYQGSNDSLSQQSHELKRIDTEIAEIKSRIEGEAHLLSGVETLLDFVSEDKRSDLLTKQEYHQVSIVELNEDLNALEDEKSFLLASFGKVDDVKNRVSELEKQIETYFDNCEQLRRMQDVAVVEELPEIRDNIEFCENMVDTLQDELNGLLEKLGELGELDNQDGAPDPAIQREKRKKNQKKVMEELIDTEKSYVQYITMLTRVMDRLAENENSGINIKVLFSNLPAIVELSTKLLEELEIAHEVDQEPDEIPGNVASCFIDVASEMKECYSTYCQNYEEAQVLLEKYEEDTYIWNLVNTTIENLCNEYDMVLFNFSSYLIKPVQRVLKYPLLLSEILKNHSDEGLNREVIKFALTTVTDVATAINEFKRRKDLVQKYRETEDGIGKKVQKLNWHSVAKKSSRINQRITQFTGLNTQTVDETFNEEEKKFRGLEKLIKSIVKNVAQFVEDFNSHANLEHQCAESLRQFHDEEDAGEEVIKYYSKISIITDNYAQQSSLFINEHVMEPLKELLQLFQGPFRLIQKRNDKCLDYDRAKNKADKAKDSKERDKISQTQEELQLQENIFVALNTQLLEELPTLYNKCSEFTKYCLANFAEASKRFLNKAYSQLHELWELPFIVKDVDLFERHHDLIQKATFQLACLSFIPANSNKEQRRSQVINNAILKASFFVEFDSSSEDPTSPIKPLIDFSPDGIDTVDKSKESNQNSKDSIADLSTDSIGTPTSRWIVKHTFEAEGEAEITALEGTVVNVLRKSDKNGNTEWWLVEQDGRKGYIPDSFLKEEKKTLAHSASDSKDLNILTPVTRPVLTSEKVISSSAVDRKEIVGNSKFYTSENNGNQSHVANSRFYADTPSDDIKNQSSDTNLTSKNKLTTEKAESLSNSEDNISVTSSYSEDRRSLKSVTSDGGELNVNQYYAVEYDFDAINAGEISVKEGQVVNVLRKHDQKGNSEWWCIEYDGQHGFVPRDYLVFVDRSQMC